jgi:molecular chaperone GrpE
MSKIKKQTTSDAHKNVGQSDEWKNKYIRALADYQNLERRTQIEKEQIRKFAAEVVLTRLLPVVDTLKKATQHMKDKGLDLTYKELLAVLSEFRVEPIEAVGKEFNPHEMECVEVVQGEENIVVEETIQGYRYYGKVLRVAQVKVGKEHQNN